MKALTLWDTCRAVELPPSNTCSSCIADEREALYTNSCHHCSHLHVIFTCMPYIHSPFLLKYTFVIYLYVLSNSPCSSSLLTLLAWHMHCTEPIAYILTKIAAQTRRAQISRTYIRIIRTYTCTCCTCTAPSTS